MFIITNITHLIPKLVLRFNLITKGYKGYQRPTHSADYLIYAGKEEVIFHNIQHLNWKNTDKIQTQASDSLV